MKSKELSKLVRDKVVEKYRSGLGYGLDKEGINQRRSKETKDNPEGAAKLHSGDGSVCPYCMSTLSRTLHRAGLYGRVSRKKVIASRKK